MEPVVAISNVLPTVFIVDDSEAVRFALSLLVKTFGWRVQAFDSAAAFLDAQATRREPGCLLLDLNMPIETGADLLERTGLWLPAIVITAHPDGPLTERAWRCGVTAILTKPFDDETLLEHLLHVLGTPESASVESGT